MHAARLSRFQVRQLSKLSVPQAITFRVPIMAPQKVQQFDRWRFEKTDFCTFTNLCGFLDEFLQAIEPPPAELPSTSTTNHTNAQTQESGKQRWNNEWEPNYPEQIFLHCWIEWLAKALELYRSSLEKKDSSIRWKKDAWEMNSRLYDMPGSFYQAWEAGQIPEERMGLIIMALEHWRSDLKAIIAVSESYIHEQMVEELDEEGAVKITELRWLCAESIHTHVALLVFLMRNRSGSITANIWRHIEATDDKHPSNKSNPSLLARLTYFIKRARRFLGGLRKFTTTDGLRASNAIELEPAATPTPINNRTTSEEPAATPTPASAESHIASSPRFRINQYFQAAARRFLSGQEELITGLRGMLLLAPAAVIGSTIDERHQFSITLSFMSLRSLWQTVLRQNGVSLKQNYLDPIATRTDCQSGKWLSQEAVGIEFKRLEERLGAGLMREKLIHLLLVVIEGWRQQFKKTMDLTASVISDRGPRKVSIPELFHTLETEGNEYFRLLYFLATSRSEAIEERIWRNLGGD
ncbi:hypothetical protein BJ508DRAFT_35047 [Ascobolus immersus RN42]|uniref:Uncharacterized protein n=1 Tax=Ascobolus immersus RN42 TaxID=1160509 RepID=A0A3N4HNG0_ASCIM|nr:hypothetical protein BJ508DRAFT_35047 [Ascobolus immersus RN42]